MSATSEMLKDFQKAALKAQEDLSNITEPINHDNEDCEGCEDDDPVERKNIYAMLEESLEQENAPLHLELYQEEINLLLKAKSDNDKLMEVIEQNVEQTKAIALASLSNRLMAFEGACRLLLTEVQGPVTPSIQLIKRLLQD